MKATFINREINTVSMTMEITAEEFDKALDDVYQSKKHLFTVDGFRKGKAPRKLIESKYGKAVFYEDAIGNVFNENYPVALDELGFEPVDHPKIDMGDQTVEAGKGFVFNIKFITEPEVKVKNYKGIKVKVQTPTVSDEELENQLKSYAKRNARLVTVDREAAEGDTVILDYAGFMMDGTQFEGGTAEGHKLELGSHEFIPGFEEQLVGVKANEERDVSVVFPIDYPEENLAGERVEFKCKIHEVKEEEIPEIDDDLAKECSEFDTLDEWKVEIKNKMLATKRQQNENIIKNDIIKQLYDATVIDTPDVMVEHEVDDLLRQFDQQLGYTGMELDSYLDATHTALEDFREQVRDEAQKRVNTRLLIESIAREEGLTAEDDEIQEELRKLSVQYGVTPEKMREIVGGDIKFVIKEITGKKAVQRLVDYADIEEYDGFEPVSSGESDEKDGAAEEEPASGEKSE